MKIKKGDNVKILSGKDRGKIGRVIKVDHKNNKITVEGINVYKKHVRPKRQGERGELIQVVRPLPASKVMLVCSVCNRGVRVGYRFENNKNKKVRYCKRCQTSLN
jgi:large subunit ribosomal protein L24